MYTPVAIFPRTRPRFPARLLLLALLSFTSSCASRPTQPDLAGIYQRAAQELHEDRNPVVVLPGILGSKLRDTRSSRVVWGAFGGGSADPETPDGARLVALSMEPGKPLAELSDEVVPDGALDRVRLRLFGFLPVGLSAYSYILGALGVGGYRDETLGLAGVIDYGDDHYTCFQYDYDWRRDIVESAHRLNDFLLEKREQVLAETARRGLTVENVRFDLVAHSMGSLVALYFLRYGAAELPEDGEMPEVTWAGRELVERAIFIAPPTAGSYQALEQLVEGVDFGIFLPNYEPGILGTMPSIYQMLPRGRHGVLSSGDEPPSRIEDLLDPELWESRRWGLADPDQADVIEDLLPEIQDPDERRRIALDHQRKCLARAARFQRAIDTPAATPEGLDLHLVAGDAEPTPARATIDPGTGRPRVDEHGPGDGTVLRTSTLCDERVGAEWSSRLVSPHDWERVLFLFTNHLGLTRDPVFIDNVLYTLLEEPRR